MAFAAISNSLVITKALPVIAIDVANNQTCLPVDPQRLEDAVRMILEAASLSDAQISVAVVDDPTIARLHETYLGDSDPTDVLSFVLESADGYLEGEVVVSAETAAAMAPRFGWPAADELLLYVIHGTLHLVGCDDATPQQQARMRAREQACLARFGLQGHYEASEAQPSGEPCPAAESAAGGKEIP